MSLKSKCSAGRRLTSVNSMPCEEFTKLAQSSGPENIDPERPLPCRRAAGTVLSPSRITLENNGKIRPQPEGEKQFPRASGGGDGPAVQPSPPDPYRGSGALQRVATFAAIFKRLRPKPLRRQASGKEVTHRPVQQSEWTVGNGHGVNCLAGSQFLHRGRSKAGP